MMQTLPLTGSAICEIRSYVYRTPISSPVQTSFGTMRDRPMVLVRIEDTEGMVGWGEIWCNFPACGAEHRARLVTSVLAPLLLGRTLVDPSEMWSDLTNKTEILAIQSGERGPIAQAIAGVDIALWDLVARRSDLPLWRLLGGESGTIGVYASGLNPDEPERAALTAQRAGYRAFKLKVGFDDALDERNVRVLRDILDPAAALMLDANQAWDVEGAIQAAARLGRYAIGWLEEPLRADRPLNDWQQLAATVNIPLAAGENITSAEDFYAAIASGALGVVQPDIAKWGGFSACRSIARAIREQGRRFCPHYLGGGVGLLASAHLLAAIGGDGLLEVDTNENPLRDILAGSINVVREGHVTLPEHPGLGILPDLGELAAFTVAHYVAS